MRRDVRSLVVAGLLLGACGPDPLPIVGDEGSVGSAGDGDGDYGDGDGDSVYGDGDGDGSTESAPPPFSRDLTGLVQNTAQWGDFTVKLVAARVERGMDESWGSDEGWSSAGIEPDEIYLELDIQLGNLQHTDNELARRDTWDVVLRDGSRIELVSAFGASLSPLGTASYTLRYPVPADFELEDASLELNGPARGTLHPERVPLDATFTPDIDIALPELEGKTFESSRIDDSEQQRRVVIRSARLRRNSLTEKRAPYGAYFLDMEVGITLVDAWRGNVGPDSFRIDVNGEAFEPANVINEILEEGLIWNTPVVFEVKDSVRDFDLRVRTSSDSGQTPEIAYQKVHVSW